MGDETFRAKRRDLKLIRKTGDCLVLYNENGERLDCFWDAAAKWFILRNRGKAPALEPSNDYKTTYRDMLGNIMRRAAEGIGIPSENLKIEWRDSSPLPAPEVAPIESDDAPEYDVEQARVALWNKAMGMEPPAMAEFPKVEIGPVKRLPPDAARTSDWQLAAEVIRIADRFIDTVKKFATGEISYTMGMIGEAAAQAGLAIEAACNGDPPQANVDVASYAKSLTSDLLDARKSVKQFGVILDEIRAMVCPHEGMYRSVPRYVRELKEENDRLHAAADSAMAGVLASKATFDAESATLDDGVGMWGWKESARIMPTDSRNIWIWVCRPGATESRLMRASDFHGIEPKMRVEYWRHAETPTPPKR